MVNIKINPIFYQQNMLETLYIRSLSLHSWLFSYPSSSWSSSSAGEHGHSQERGWYGREQVQEHAQQVHPHLIFKFGMLNILNMWMEQVEHVCHVYLTCFYMLIAQKIKPHFKDIHKTKKRQKARKCSIDSTLFVCLYSHRGTSAYTLICLTLETFAGVALALHIYSNQWFICVT